MVSKKKILLVGYMGYHEYTTTLPIVNQLELIGCEVVRIGGDTDWFVEENKQHMIANWVLDSDSINLKDFDIVFFIDWWNRTVPLMHYKKSIENPNVKFVALCHGTVNFDSDVAHMFTDHKEYEHYLTKCYDKVLVPYDWLTKIILPYQDLIDKSWDKFVTTLWPTDLLQERDRPEIEPTNRIIYSHRFGSDKGDLDFINFVMYCRRSNDDYIRNISFIITDDLNDEDMRMCSQLGITVTGRLSQDKLKELCKKGGYAWGMPSSETFGYAVLDLVSYGLHPLLDHHPAYSHFPEKFKFDTMQQATRLIKDTFPDFRELKMSNKEWYDMIRPMKLNAFNMALEIVRT